MTEHFLSNHWAGKGAEGERARYLLIVDDDPRVCRALSRCLLSSFDMLQTVTTVTEADYWLCKEMFTHLICDQNLGNDVPKGIELVKKWRHEHPSIRRAVLFTGDHLDNALMLPELDAILHKSADIFKLLKALGG